jgi:hypothetical protein
LPAALNQIILMAIEKDPAQRFQSADAFRNALKSASGTLPTARPAASQSALAALAGPASATPVLHNDALVAPVLESSGASSQPVPSMPQLSAQQKSHRGLYMTLGAMIVLAVLVVAGIYVPRRAKTSANEEVNVAQQEKPASPVTRPNLRIKMARPQVQVRQLSARLSLLCLQATRPAAAGMTEPAQMRSKPTKLRRRKLRNLSRSTLPKTILRTRPHLFRAIKKWRLVRVCRRRRVRISWKNWKSRQISFPARPALSTKAWTLCEGSKTRKD